jgi:hypothetical protein
MLEGGAKPVVMRDDVELTRHALTAWASIPPMEADGLAAMAYHRPAMPMAAISQEMAGVLTAWNEAVRLMQEPGPNPPAILTLGALKERAAVGVKLFRGQLEVHAPELEPAAKNALQRHFSTFMTGQVKRVEKASMDTWPCDPKKFMLVGAKSHEQGRGG